MNCPFCNAKMKEGHVFCEACGKEIHLVPLFEPEVEETMKNSISGMMDRLNEDPVSEKDTTIEYNVSSKTQKISLKNPNFLGALVAGIFLIVAMSILIAMSQVSKEKDFSFYYTGAKDFYASEDYEKALNYLEKAFSIEKNEANELEYDEALGLYANCLLQKKSYADLEAFFMEKNKENQASYSLYDIYFDYLRNKEDYQQLAKFLSDCNNSDISQKYSDYICEKPSFDIQPGTYDEIVYLKLLSTGSGKIYYTINGEVPTTQGDEYISPIRLENGTFDIKAMFINNYGLVSEMIEGVYSIAVTTPDEPEVSLDSGNYYEPKTIELFVPDDSYSVYYTLDGSTPNYSSLKYEVPIPLPFGTSHFQFVMYNSDDVASDIAVRDYTFTLNNVPISMEQAKVLLLQNLIVSGVINNMDGLVTETGELKSYDCNTAIKQNASIYYLFSEIKNVATGTTKTGIYYAVDGNNGSVFQVKIDEQGNYLVY